MLAANARHRIDADAFHHHERQCPGEDQRPLPCHQGQVERHADGKKEQPEQNAAEGFDVGFELMTEGGFRKQHAGEERAHRHRETAELHAQRRAEHDEERGGGHDFARLRFGQEPEKRIEEPQSGGHEQRDRGSGNADRLPEFSRRKLRGTRREQGHEHEQGHDREIFQEQNRNDALAARRGRFAPFVEQLHHGRGRGEHEAGRGEERHERRKPPGHAGQRQQKRADGNLRYAEPENFLSQAPEPRRLHLEADDEEKHHDAKLGDMQDCLRIGKQPQAERADHDAGGEIAEHGAEPDALENRHRDDAGREQRDHLHELGARMGVCGHRDAPGQMRSARKAESGRTFRSLYAEGRKWRARRDSNSRPPDS
jgi:hypothetical protein